MLYFSKMTFDGTSLLIRRLLCAACAVMLSASSIAAQDARLARVVPKSAIKELTRSILLDWEKYMKVSGDEKAALRQTLSEAIHRRAEGLEALIRSDPRAIDEFKLPPDVRATLPPEFAPFLETPFEATGVLQNDPSPDPGISEAFPYRLRDGRGRIYQLYRIGPDPLFSIGAEAKVSGILFGNRLIFRGGNSGDFQQQASLGSAPPVRFIAPEPNQVIHKTFTLQVDTGDPGQATRVEILQNGRLLAAIHHRPFEYRWDTRSEFDGPHTLAAKAYDRDLNVSGSQNLYIMIDNTPPRAQWLEPEARMNLAGRVTLTADATDNIGVQSVRFLVDGASVGVAVSPPYTFEWDSTTHPNGSITFQALAVDRAGNTAHSDAVTANLINDNSPPVIEPIATQTVKESTAIRIPVAAHDPDGPRDSVTLRAFNFPAWLHFEPISALIYGTPPYDAATPEEPVRVYDNLVIEACDNQPLCAQTSFSIRVLNVNHPPSISRLPDIELVEGEDFEIIPFVSDPDGDPLTCRVYRKPAFMHFHEDTCSFSGTVPHTVVNREMGEHAFKGIRLEACDPQGECDAAQFALTVAYRNRSPELALIRDTHVREGRQLVIDFHAHDPDDDTLTFDIQGLPDGARFIDYGSGQARLTWTPEADQAGNYPITLAVTDSLAVETQVFSIAVKEAILAFSGRVVDDLNRGVPGVAVEYSRAGGFKRSVMTDAQGYFIAAGVEPGTYTLKPSYGLRDNLPTSGIIHFKPISTRIDLRSKDIADISFTALGFD